MPISRGDPSGAVGFSVGEWRLRAVEGEDKRRSGGWPRRGGTACLARARPLGRSDCRRRAAWRTPACACQRPGARLLPRRPFSGRTKSPGLSCRSSPSSAAPSPIGGATMRKSASFSTSPRSGSSGSASRSPTSSSSSSLLDRRRLDRVHRRKLEPSARRSCNCLPRHRPAASDRHGADG